MSSRMPQPSQERVCVIGAGYVGLPLAVMLARNDYDVLCVDIQPRIVAAINAGRIPFAEQPLADAFDSDLVRRNLRAGAAPDPADIFVIAVPTPVDRRRRIADLSDVKSAVASIVPCLEPGNLVIVESTVPPLTCRNVILPIIEGRGLKVGTDIYLAHCPERILPGNIVEEIIGNDRIIGGVTPEAAERAARLYRSFIRGELLQTDDVTAELCKLMENTYRDVNLALANEFAAVCGTLGVDVLEAIRLANRHPRVEILRPGIGTGGHCIPVDPWFIHEVDPDNARLIETARRINDEVPARIAAKIRQSVAGIDAPRIALIGAAYKPDTADVRESPAVHIAQSLTSDGFAVSTYDPHVTEYEWPVGGVLEVARGMDCLAILVEHSVVRDELRLSTDSIRRAMRSPVLLRFFQEDGAAPRTSNLRAHTEAARV